MTTVYLTGEMGRLFGRKWKLAVTSPAEALRAIEANKPGLIAYLAAAGDRGVDFRVKVNGEAVDPERLNFNRSDTVIRFSPVVRGRKDEWFGIILGVVLVAVTWGAGAGWLGAGMKAFMASTALGITGMTYGALVGGIGISMALSGISRMLTPTPTLGGSGDSAGQPSYLFSGPVNTTAQGGCVPLCYGGPILIGSQVISAGIYSEDMGGSQEAAEGPFTEDGSDTEIYDEEYVPPAPDNLVARSLRTRQKARILDLLGEGEMALCDENGAVLSDEDRNKAVLFDLTPAQNPDGSFAHKGFSTSFRPGSEHQTWMPGFPAAESETAVEAKVIRGSDKVGNGVQRQVPAGPHNAIRVTVRVPALYEYDNKGNRRGTLLHFSIQLKRSAESDWHEAVGSNPLPGGELDGLIQGEAIQPYVRSYRIPLWGTGPWDVRILRETVDSTDPAKYQNDLYWQSYTTIIDRKFTYKHSAIVGSEFDAEKFARIPQRAFRVLGCKVRVPSNYNPATRSYAGVWDGTFKANREWTNNPAWIFYDLATHSRYGLGNYVPEATMDKWALYDIARYCDGVDGSGNFVGVDSGRGDGSREPRFAASVYIQSQEDAFKVLSDFASIFRGMVFWATGLVSAVQDSPKDPRFTFTNANVINGDFVYSGTDRMARHTVAYVQWNDPDDFFIAKPLEVPDEDGIARFGVRPTNVVAFGCTSRGQAWRVGKWLLLTEHYENETVTFRTQLHGARVRPGDVIRVRDRYETAGRMGGRVLTVGAGTIELDAPVDLAAGVSYTLFVARLDGTDTELAITSPAGVHQTLSFTGDATGVERMAVWMLRSDEVEPVEFRVLNVKEIESHQFEIIALRYIAGKYAAVENGEELEVPPTSDLPDRGIPIPPTDLVVRESAVATADGRVRYLDVGWRASASRYIRGYRVEIRTPGGAWEDLDAFTTELRSKRFPVTVLGEYNFRVTTIGYHQVSDPATVSYTLAEVAPPTDVAGIVVTPIANGFDIAWQDDLGDLGYYLIYLAPTDTLPPQPTYAAPGGTSQKTFANVGSEVLRHVWMQKALHRVQLYGPITYAGSFTTLKSTAESETVIFEALNGKNRSFIGPTEPTTGMVPGDVWFDTSDLNRIYRYDGTDWIDVQKVLELDDFGLGVRPVEIVDALPATGNFKGRVVLLTTDDKIYRWTNDVIGTGTDYWSAAVNSADIAGQLTNAQIADLAAGKISGQLISTQIADDAITTPKLAAGAVNAGKLAAGSVTAEKIDALAVTAEKIAADAVTAGKIAAGAVTADKVGANTIITQEANIGWAVIKEVHIAEATIATGKIADAAVNTLKIAGQAVTVPTFVESADMESIDNNVWTEVAFLSVSLQTGWNILLFFGFTYFDDALVMFGGVPTTDFDVEIRRNDDSVVAFRGQTVRQNGTELIAMMGMDLGIGTAWTSYRMFVRPRGGGVNARPSIRGINLGILTTKR